jgi:hypothetical protein
VLYVPRAFYHHTATHEALLDAPDVVGDGVGGAGRDTPDDAYAEVLSSHDELVRDQPSMALTVSVLCEDVFATWLFLLGEALQEVQGRSRRAMEEAAEAVRAIRRVAAAEGMTDEREAGARLREALPRAVAVRCGLSDRRVFTHEEHGTWRTYAVGLLSDALALDGALGGLTPPWLRADAADAPLALALEAVLRRKRIPCALKLEQIETMRDAVRGRTPLTGAALSDIDVDGIFRIEKRDKAYLPADRDWFQPRTWT